MFTAMLEVLIYLGSENLYVRGLLPFYQLQQSEYSQSDTLDFLLSATTDSQVISDTARIVHRWNESRPPNTSTC